MIDLKPGVFVAEIPWGVLVFDWEGCSCTDGVWTVTVGIPHERIPMGPEELIPEELIAEEKRAMRRAHVEGRRLEERRIALQLARHRFEQGRAYRLRGLRHPQRRF